MDPRGRSPQGSMLSSSSGQRATDSRPKRPIVDRRIVVVIAIVVVVVIVIVIVIVMKMKMIVMR